jgi:hypothetical protein
MRDFFCWQLEVTSSLLFQHQSNSSKKLLRDLGIDQRTQLPLPLNAPLAGLGDAITRRSEE